MWFDDIKSSNRLYQFLYEMPKGGDLHNHLTGSGYPQWWLEAAQQEGMFQNLTKAQTSSWLSRATTRKHLRPLFRKPAVLKNILRRNIEACLSESISYVEFMIRPTDEVIEALLQVDTQGVVIKFQAIVMRKGPGAVKQLSEVENFVKRHESCVAINLGGTDEDKGPPSLFNFVNVPFSCHAGETTKPNSYVEDSIKIGADRIGHGINLIHSKNMSSFTHPIEICLISNYKLGHINSYHEHPLRAYIDNDIPVMLCTDNKGLTNSSLTDEFFVAVTTFDLTWEEVYSLAENSLKYAFVDDKTKTTLINKFHDDMKIFLGSTT